MPIRGKCMVYYGLLMYSQSAGDFLVNKNQKYIRCIYIYIFINIHVYLFILYSFIRDLCI